MIERTFIIWKYKSKFIFIMYIEINKFNLIFYNILINYKINFISNLILFNLI